MTAESHYRSSMWPVIACAVLYLIIHKHHTLNTANGNGFTLLEDSVRGDCGEVYEDYQDYEDARRHDQDKRLGDYSVWRG